MKYKVEPLDIKRFLVEKIDKTRVFYLVELDFFGAGLHGCGCPWFEKNNWNGPRKHCKHIQLVEAHCAKNIPQVQKSVSQVSN